MPPMNKAHQSTLQKRVDYIAKDDDARTATGVVMVPDKVDLQGDFAREDLIREFATQFENFYEANEADAGIMHAAWPSGWMELDRNEVLDEATEIGGQTVEAGAWVQGWQYNDDELWSLVDDGILAGHSIGAIDVSWSPAMAQEELPDDVGVAADYPDDQPVYQLQGGLIREVSPVDVPAVPDAQILTAAAKGGVAKRLGDHLGNRDAFIEEAMERGHSEEDAERMWSVLHRAIDVDGAGEPGKNSAFERLGKAVRDVLTLRSDASAEGRPDAKAAGHESAGDGADGQADKDDTGGDTPDDTTMSNDDPMADAPPWAKALNDRIDDLESDKDAADDGGDPMDDAPQWAKDLDDRIDDLEEETKAGEEKPEWAKSLENRVDEISKQTGATESQQLGGTETGADGGDEKNSGFTLDPRAAGGN